MKNLNQLKGRIQVVMEKYDIRKAGIFRTCSRNDAMLRSVYLLVELKSKMSLIEFMGIQHDLEDELGIRVGVFEYDAMRSALQRGVIAPQYTIHPNHHSLH